MIGFLLLDKKNCSCNLVCPSVFILVTLHFRDSPKVVWL
jgi:hypothetical protein